jgi:hypothetical protein
MIPIDVLLATISIVTGIALSFNVNAPSTTMADTVLKRIIT